MIWLQAITIVLLIMIIVILLIGPDRTIDQLIGIRILFGWLVFFGVPGLFIWWAFFK